MKNLIMQKDKWFQFIFVMALAVVIAGCKKDDPDVLGCTDPDGDQYNAAANVDDGSCTYFNRFTGTWNGVFGCQGALMAAFTSAQIQITESVSATNDVVSVTVISTALPGPLPVVGTITKNDLTLSANLPNVPLALAGLPPGLIMNITVSGVLTLQADGSLSGNVMVSLMDTTGILAMIIMTDTLADNCTFTATK